MTIYVAGSVFLDIVMCPLDHAPRPGEEQWVENCNVLPGGAANQAVAASRLGAQTALVTYLGMDPMGAMVEQMLSEEGIDLSLAKRSERQSLTVALVHDSDRSFTTFGCDDAPAVAGEAPQVLMASLPYLRQNAETIGRWHDEGTIVIADTGWDDSGAWDPADLDILQIADIFVPNCSEAEHYTRTLDPQSAALALAERVPTVVVTCGGAGVTCCQLGEVTIHPAVPSEVVDTTGAGDSFSAGLAVGLTRGLAMADAIALGQLAAAWTVRGLGGSTSAPTLEDLRTWVRSEEMSEYRGIIEAI